MAWKLKTWHNCGRCWLHFALENYGATVLAPPLDFLHLAFKRVPNVCRNARASALPKAAAPQIAQERNQMRADRYGDDVSNLCWVRKASAARSPPPTQLAMELPGGNARHDRPARNAKVVASGHGASPHLGGAGRGEVRQSCRSRGRVLCRLLRPSDRRDQTDNLRQSERGERIGPHKSLDRNRLSTLFLNASNDGVSAGFVLRTLAMLLRMNHSGIRGVSNISYQRGPPRPVVFRLSIPLRTTT